MEERTRKTSITRRQVAALKKRRDVLLNRACSRQEREVILEEVRAINDQLRLIDERMPHHRR